MKPISDLDSFDNTIKKVSKGSELLSRLSNFYWYIFQWLNRVLPEGEPIHPNWAPRPLLKSYERTVPILGFPRETNSVCPKCVRERRLAVSSRESTGSEAVNNSINIKAQIIEEAGKIIIRKGCSKHGSCEDLLAEDPAFLHRLESLFVGRDFTNGQHETIGRMENVAIKFGRGAVLMVNLTELPNLNGDAHCYETSPAPSLDEIQAILDRAISFIPRRQIIVLFTGDDATESEICLSAIAYAKRLGFYRILVETDGRRFAEDIGFCRAARSAGLHGVYLKVNGVNCDKGNEELGTSLKAIDNIADVGIKITLVTSVANTINNGDVGKTVEFAAKNIDKIQTITFQPICFSGANDKVSDEVRIQQRYTLCHLARDLENQLAGQLHPLRDWFPLSSYSTFTSLMDMLQGADASWGWSSCNCHPDCGMFSLIVVNRNTGEFKSLFEFFDYEQFMKDVTIITDTARSKRLVYAQLVMAIMRNFDAAKAPKGFAISNVLNLFKPASDRADTLGKSSNSLRTDPSADAWRVLCVEAIWFQDLFNYDCQRTEMCVFPYGTRNGEISYCAQNAGIS